MAAKLSYSDLQAEFANASSLPQLPGVAIRLIQLLESDDVSGGEVERTIISDPALTAALLRASSSALYGSTDRTTTVRGAITRLGYRTVQAVAVSLGVNALMNSCSGLSYFSPNRFARHSLFVGFLARYVFACRYSREPFPSKWNRDEVFAAAVLHDLGYGLLATISAETLELVSRTAKSHQKSFHEAFFEQFDHPLVELGVTACHTWGLPPLFAEMIGNYEHALEHKTESVALACLAYADHVANENSHDVEGWRAAREIDPAILEIVGLPDEEMPGVVLLVTRHTSAYAPSVGAA